METLEEQSIINERKEHSQLENESERETNHQPTVSMIVVPEPSCIMLSLSQSNLNGNYACPFIALWWIHRHLHCTTRKQNDVVKKFSLEVWLHLAPEWKPNIGRPARPRMIYDQYPEFNRTMEMVGCIGGVFTDDPEQIVNMFGEDFAKSGAFVTLRQALDAAFRVAKTKPIGCAITTFSGYTSAICIGSLAYYHDQAVRREADKTSMSKYVLEVGEHKIDPQTGVGIAQGDEAEANMYYYIEFMDSHSNSASEWRLNNNGKGIWIRMHSKEQLIRYLLYRNPFSDEVFGNQQHNTESAMTDEGCPNTFMFEILCKRTPPVSPPTNQELTALPTQDARDALHHQRAYELAQFQTFQRQLDTHLQKWIEDISTSGVIHPELMRQHQQINNPQTTRVLPKRAVAHPGLAATISNGVDNSNSGKNSTNGHLQNVKDAPNTNSPQRNRNVHFTKQYSV